jgi:nitrogen fixation protein NifU and related proteins
MDSLYKEIVLDHYKNPHNFGTLDPADYTAEDSNPLCGDQIRMDLRVVDGTVTDVKFTGRGCAVSVASASILTDMVMGRPLDEVRQITKEDLLDEIGIPVSPARMKCATLGLTVLNMSLALKEAHVGADS